MRPTRADESKAVACAAEDTATMLAHQIGDPTVAQIECTNRALLVQRRKAVEAGNIGGKDGCKLSIHSGDHSCCEQYRCVTMCAFSKKLHSENGGFCTVYRTSLPPEEAAIEVHTSPMRRSEPSLAGSHDRRRCFV